MTTRPFDYEPLTVGATAVPLTTSKIEADDGRPATRAVITIETAQLRYRTDGTAPTSTEGHLGEIGDVITLEGTDTLRQFQAIRTGSTSAVIKVTYERE